jgi:hypothetical protein
MPGATARPGWLAEDSIHAKTFRGNLYSARRIGHNAGKTAGILPGGLRADALLYLRASTNVDRVGDTPGEIISNPAGITVKINRRAYSPVLRHARLPADTTIPWWNGRQLRFEFA